MTKMKQRRKLPLKAWKLLNWIDLYHSNNKEFSISNKELSEKFKCHPKTVTFNVRVLRELGLVEQSYKIIPTGSIRILTITDKGHLKNQFNPIHH